MPRVLTAARELADYFEAVVKAVGGEGKTCANWVMGDLSAVLNKEDNDISASPVSAQVLGELLMRIVDNTISGKIAKEVFEAMWSGEGSADDVIDRKGLKQITDTGAIEGIIDEVMAAQREADRRVPRRPGQAARLFRRPGDEGDPGQGQPAAGQRAAEAEAGSVINHIAQRRKVKQ